MESEKGKETVGHVRPEAEEEETKVLEEENTRLPSSSSSASSSPRGSFEHDVMENSPPNDDSITKWKSKGDLSQGHNRPPQAPERGVSSNASPQTTSPPVQKMEQSSNYEPNRIPASIFASKPANASEWSVASNDSLFSIHVGNNSFSKDQFKSAEILRLDDQSLSLYVPEAKSNELCSLPPLMEVPPHEESSSVKSSRVSTLEKEEEAMKGSSTPRPSHERAQPLLLSPYWMVKEGRTTHCRELMRSRNKRGKHKILLMLMKNRDISRGVRVYLDAVEIGE